MTSQILHWHRVGFNRREGKTSAVCLGCDELLVPDVHAWAEERQADGDEETLEGTLRELIENAVNSVH